MSEYKNSLDEFLEERNIDLSNSDNKQKVVIPTTVWLDVTQDIIEPTWLLRYQGVGFSPLGDIQAVRGMEGNGKSMLLTILMAAVLSGSCGGLTCDIPNARVLYVDTEQKMASTLFVQRRVHHLCGWRGKEANARFRVMMLREVEDLQDRNSYL